MTSSAFSSWEARHEVIQRGVGHGVFVLFLTINSIRALGLLVVRLVVGVHRSSQHEIGTSVRHPVAWVPVRRPCRVSTWEASDSSF